MAFESLQQVWQQRGVLAVCPTLREGSELLQEPLRSQLASCSHTHRSAADPSHLPSTNSFPSRPTHPAYPHPTAVRGWPAVRLNCPAARVPPMGCPCTALAFSSSRAMSWQYVAGWYCSLLQAGERWQARGGRPQLGSASAHCLYRGTGRTAACSHDCSHGLQRIEGAWLRVVQMMLQPAPQQRVRHPAGWRHAVGRCEGQPWGDQRRAAHMVLSSPAAQAAHVREPAGMLQQGGHAKTVAVAVAAAAAAVTAAGPLMMQVPWHHNLKCLLFRPRRLAIHDELPAGVQQTAPDVQYCQQQAGEPQARLSRHV